MPNICPTVTAFNAHEYRDQMEKLQVFAPRIHIDLMDGQFTPSNSQSLSESWWPDSLTADIHLMYKYPEMQLQELISLKPSLVIFHYEAYVEHEKMAQSLRANGIKAGLALLQETRVETIKDLLPEFDHVLVFSGNLGYHGGEADLSLTAKVKELRKLNSEIEIAWDGGINDQNVSELVAAGVDVLNVGGFIYSNSDPKSAYAKLEALAR
jgi:ribulose-phosphate 3-epimerase